MKALSRKIIASIILAALISGGIEGFFQSRAQAYPEQQTNQITAEMSGNFDISAATAYARRNWDEYWGYCADFCYLIMLAGGFVFYGEDNWFRAYTQYDHLVNELGLRSYFLGNGKVTQNAHKIAEGDLVMWDLAYRLEGITSDTVSIRGSGGHIVYISVANGPNSRFIGRNPEQLDAKLETGGTHGMWLIKTSDLAGGERIEVTDITPTKYEILVSGNIHMTPNGAQYYDDDGNHVTTTVGETLLMDKISEAGGYIWGRIAKPDWDWIVNSQGRAMEVEETHSITRQISNWIGEVIVISNSNVQSSPNGGVYRRILVVGGIQAWPNVASLGNEAAGIGEIFTIQDKKASGDWLWSRFANGLWEWVEFEGGDRGEKRFEFLGAMIGENYTITEQVVVDDWIWGRIENTNAWIAIENLTTRETRCEKYRIEVG